MPTPIQSQAEPPDPYPDFIPTSNQTTEMCAPAGVKIGSPFTQPMEQDVDMFAEVHAPLDSLSWDEFQTHNWSNLNPPPVHGVVDPSHMMDSMPLITPSHSFPDWKPYANGDNGVNTLHRSFTQPLPELHNTSSPKKHGRTKSSSTDNGDDTSKSNIIQLTKLMTWFSRLQRLSYDLASTLESHQTNDLKNPHEKPLIDETTFQSVSEWLVYDPSHTGFPIAKHSQSSRLSRASTEEATTSHVLCHLFSASHALLEALLQLQLDATSSNPTSTAVSAAPTPPALDPGEASALKLDAPPSPPGDHSQHVVRHMAVACYTILLNTYVSVLNTLEHDANLNFQMNGVAPADIRLASVVQLCIYLTDRQQKAMDSYLSAQHPSQALWQDCHIPGRAQAGAAPEEEMRNLKMEVEQRLARLQQVLHA